MNALSRLQAPLLSVLRIISAYLFIWHGTAKVFGYPASMGDISGNPMMIAAAALELVGGGLLLLGLFTRPVAFLLSGQMAVAYFMAHAAQGNVLMPLANSGELAVLFCFVFLYLSAAGAGTVRFFEDQTVVKGLQDKFPPYAENFPVWAEHADAMHQYAIWTALASINVGASLQHYNPVIDEAVARTWNVPASWKLRAQLVFGGIAAPAGEKSFEPVEARLKVYGL